MIVNHADGTRVESPFTVSEDLFEKWTTLAKDMMDLSGERLAFVLNDIIEHKRHKEAQKEGRALPSIKLAVGTAPTTPEVGPPAPGAKRSGQTEPTTPGANTGINVETTQRT